VLAVASRMPDVSASYRLNPWKLYAGASSTSESGMRRCPLDSNVIADGSVLGAGDPLRAHREVSMVWTRQAFILSACTEVVTLGAPKEAKKTAPPRNSERSENLFFGLQL